MEPEQHCRFPTRRHTVVGGVRAERALCGAITGFSSQQMDTATLSRRTAPSNWRITFSRKPATECTRNFRYQHVFNPWPIQVDLGGGGLFSYSEPVEVGRGRPVSRFRYPLRDGDHLSGMPFPRHL